MVTLDDIREVFAGFPGVKEGPSYGTPGFRVGKKLLGRMHQSEDALVLKMEFGEREELMEARPDLYYITDHYQDYEWILIRLAKITRRVLEGHVEKAWRGAASRRLQQEYDGRKPS